MTPISDRVIRIGDPDDARIAQYRDIRERDLVKRQSLFIAEGRTVLQILVAQQLFPVVSVLLLENRLAGIEQLIEALDESVPVYVATQQVIDEIAGFHMHRGILAVAAIPEGISALPARLPPHWKTVLLLSAISNHDNIGAIFRNAAAFGADAVILDPQCCDPLYRKAVRVSVGGVLRVPFLSARSFPAAIESLTDAGFALAALSPQGRTAITGWRPAERQALILGSEGHGLPKRWLDRLETLAIPMADGFDSLNVATAGAIALHHRTALMKPG
jgi:tRNA G18 (ribose-2'-O)-methylase SpoU